MYDYEQQDPLDLSKQNVVTEYGCPSQLPYSPQPFLERTPFPPNPSMTVEQPVNLSRKRKLTEQLVTDRATQSWSVHVQPQLVILMSEAVSNPVQVVRLAEESMQTATSSIFALLVQAVHRVISINALEALTIEDTSSLIHSCWHRLVLWLCADSDFKFKVTPIDQSLWPTSSVTTLPTLAFVKTVASFIKRYQELKIDKEELSLLYAITVFQSGHSSAEAQPIMEDRKKASIRQLQEYERGKPEAGSERFSRLLLSLPALYGINDKMFERLFCTNFLSEISMKTVLKEIIEQLFEKKGKMSKFQKVLNPALQKQMAGNGCL